MPFSNPIASGTILAQIAIQSPNFVPGVSGWAIYQNGSAEFNDIDVLGGIIGGTISGATISGSTITGSSVTADIVNIESANAGLFVYALL